MTKINNQRIINDLNLSKLSIEARNNRLDAFNQILDRNVGMFIGDKLTSEELENLISTKNDGEIEAWFSKNVPDYEAILENEYVNLIKDIKNRAQQVAKAIKES